MVQVQNYSFSAASKGYKRYQTIIRVLSSETIGQRLVCFFVLFCSDQLLFLFAMLMINVSTYLLLAKMLVFMLPLFWSSKKVFLC